VVAFLGWAARGGEADLPRCAIARRVTESITRSTSCPGRGSTSPPPAPRSTRGRATAPAARMWRRPPLISSALRAQFVFMNAPLRGTLADHGDSRSHPGIVGATSSEQRTPAHSAAAEYANALPLAARPTVHRWRHPGASGSVIVLAIHGTHRLAIEAVGVLGDDGGPPSMGCRSRRSRAPAGRGPKSTRRLPLRGRYFVAQLQAGRSLRAAWRARARCGIRSPGCGCCVRQQCALRRNRQWPR